MSFRRFAPGLAATGLVLFSAANALPDSTMSLVTTAGAPGSTVLVPVNITVDTNVVSFQFDLFYSTNYLAPGAPVGGSALADQQLYYNIVSPGDFRALGFSPSNTPLTNGVLAYVPFTIVSNSPDHDEPLTLSGVMLVSASAEPVPVNVNSNAILSITVPPRFIAIFPTNAGAVHLELTGTPGRTYVIQTTTNLSQLQWTPLVTNTNISGVLPFDDVSTPIFPVRFYRAQFDH